MADVEREQDPALGAVLDRLRLVPLPFAHEWRHVRVELERDPLRLPCVDAERVAECVDGQRPRLEQLVQDGEGFDPLRRERPHLRVLGDPGQEVDAAVRVRDPLRFDDVVLRAA